MWQFLKKRNEVDKSAVCEKREMHRINLILTISCRLQEFGDSFSMMTQNINVLGLKFITRNRLEADKNVDLQILLFTNFPPIKVKGRIVWSNLVDRNGQIYCEGGIKFTSICKEDERFLQSYIDKNSAFSYESPF